MQGTSEEQGRALPPGTPGWITVDLVDLTMRVWSEHCHRRVGVEEAIEILSNAGRLMSALDEETRK